MKQKALLGVLFSTLVWVLVRQPLPSDTDHKLLWTAVINPTSAKAARWLCGAANKLKTEPTVVEFLPTKTADSITGVQVSMTLVPNRNSEETVHRVGRMLSSNSDYLDRLTKLVIN